MRTSRRWLAFARVIAAATVPCSACETDGEGLGVTVRDSAGVAVIESTRPRWADGEGWTIDSVPALDLTKSGTGPAHEFYRVRDGVRLSDGRIAVANYGSAEVRLFSPDGEHLRSYGREGEGPGEFRRLDSVHELPGDSILAFDYWLGRFTIFDLATGGARTFGGYESSRRIDEIARLNDGRIVSSHYVLEQVVPYGLYRQPLTIRVSDADGIARDSITVIQGHQAFQFDRGDAPALFRHEGFMAAHGNEIFVGDADSLEVRVYSADGPLLRIVRVPGYDLRLTEAELAAERDALAPGPDMPAFMYEVHANRPDPEFRPAYQQLVVDAEGYIWAASHIGVAEDERPTDCNVFTPEGEWLGTVRLPAQFTIHEIGEDYVLGTRRDDLDTERVLMLRLDR